MISSHWVFFLEGSLNAHTVYIVPKNRLGGDRSSSLQQQQQQQQQHQSQMRQRPGSKSSTSQQQFEPSFRLQVICKLNPLKKNTSGLCLVAYERADAALPERILPSQDVRALNFLFCPPGALAAQSGVRDPRDGPDAGERSPTASVHREGFGPSTI